MWMIGQANSGSTLPSTDNSFGTAQGHFVYTDSVNSNGDSTSIVRIR